MQVRAEHKWRWNLSLPGWGWYTTWVEVRHDLEGVKVQIYGLWMELILDIGGLELHTSWTDRMWYVIWVEVRWYRDRDDIRTFWHGCRWGRTWMEMKRTSMGLRLDLGVAELHFSGHGWRWDVTRMEVRCKYQDLDWGETRPGWSRDFNMGAWLELVGGDMLLGWRWDANIGIWMEARCNMEVGC